MADERIIERVKRLLALSTSSNVNEAANAAAKAQELMTRHRIEAAELHASSGNASEPIDDEVAFETKSTIPWRTNLIAGIARPNGCEVYTQRNRRDGVSVHLLGSKSSVSAVTYLYAYLSREVDRLAHEEGRSGNRTRSWLRDFRLGAVAEISRRLAEASEATTETYVDSNSSALAIIDDEARRLADKVDALGLKDGRAAQVNDRSAFVSGMDAGSTVRIDSGPALGKGSAADIKDR
jgi:hypothetical protein